MTYARPTPVTFLRAVKLCFLLLFAPKKFLEHQAADNALLKEQSKDATPEPGALVVRRAFFEAAFLVAASGVLGYLGGAVFGSLCSCANPKSIMWLQIVGACLLLWGTLFVRGWEIQTYGGHTLTERVNHWICRALYLFGHRRYRFLRGLASMHNAARVGRNSGRPHIAPHGNGSHTAQYGYRLLRPITT